MELIKSSVIFNQEVHSYTLGEKFLSGVTSMMSAMLFPDKYGGIPESIVEAARQRGTFVHESCELIDTPCGSFEDAIECPEAIAYKKLMQREGFDVLASEYLISDNKVVASSIDKVLERFGEICLADIKTTYKLDMDWLRWQLSIYAYLFELQNEGKYKVEHLYAIWLKGDMATIVEVERIDAEIIKDLIQHFEDGEVYVSPIKRLARVTTALPEKYAELEDSILNVLYNAEYWASQKKLLADGVMQEMVAAGEYSWAGEQIRISRKKDTIKKTFNAKRFQADYPDLYEQYIEESPVVGSVTIKATNKKSE